MIISIIIYKPGLISRFYLSLVIPWLPVYPWRSQGLLGKWQHLSGCNLLPGTCPHFPAKQ